MCIRDSSTANSRKTSARQKDELEDMADDWDDELEVKSTRSTQAHTSSRSTRKATPYGRSSKIVPMHSNITSRSMEVCVSKPDELDVYKRQVFEEILYLHLANMSK